MKKKKISKPKKNMIVVKIDKKYFRPNEVDNLVGNANKAKKLLKWSPKRNPTSYKRNDGLRLRIN